MDYKRFVDLKQIECLVACAQTGSVTKAAEVLHMSQPSVSKAIKTMEEALGVQLFSRYAKGMSLTREGESAYRYAKDILEDLDKIQDIHAKQTIETLRMSNNPSSWFADVFLAFYTEHQEEDLHYQIYTTGTREIVQRVEDRKDDVGFVYVIKNQKAVFEYYLSRNYLEFTPLAETYVALFSGEKNNSENIQKQDAGLSALRLVQRFPDEFSPDNYWDIIDASGHSTENAETVVTTNSEYIMTRLLQQSDLSNISAAWLTQEKPSELTASRMTGLKEDQIIFGFVKRRGEALPEGVAMFVDYVKMILDAGIEKPV
ncbi:MAG: LysR family transcriptional regulator [Lachnospiraceae bacterium]|nr:LysR family transcriptional regulator [Lachnospiraceae bacterium]